MAKASALQAMDLMGWIEENKALLKPPVNNKVIWEDSGFIAMIVGGPNKRRDFHVNPSDEFFYQIKGDLYVECIEENGNRKVVHVKEGSVFMLPSMVPHSPHRVAGSLGLVIERKRTGDEREDIVWFCSECNQEMHRVRTQVENIETQVKSAIETFNTTLDLRTCKHCGHVAPEEIEEWK